MKVTLIRTYYATHTAGVLLVQDDLHNVLYSCVMLELPWRDNAVQQSCIPEGEYTVVSRVSEKFKLHYHIKDVPGRSYILQHAGNYTSQILGCQLPGVKFTHLNADKIPDVLHSRRTLDRLLALLGKSYTLTIRSFADPTHAHTVSPSACWRQPAAA